MLSFNQNLKVALTILCATSLFILSCGNKINGGTEGQEPGENKQCPPGHFGPNCLACTCQNGKCNDGISGDGKCQECTGNYWGENCDQDTITCVNGSPNLGPNGNGHCIKCLENTGWSGADCNQCADNYWGENCDKKPTCVNGTPSLGVNGNGNCLECFGDYWEVTTTPSYKSKYDELYEANKELKHARHSKGV